MWKFLPLSILWAACLAAQPVSNSVNRELPAWLRFSGEYRMRVEGFAGGGFREDNDDAYALNRVRLNLKVQPLSWLGFAFQAQDARVWGNSRISPSAPYEATMDLRLGYLELGDPNKHPLSLRAGRQELSFGDQRLIGASNWANTARSFDAVRATARFHGVRVDAFASSVVNNRNGEFDRPAAGNNLHGLYASTERAVPKSVSEAYLLWRLAPGAVDFKTIGTRWVGKLPAGFDYGVEMAVQHGAAGGQDLRAWAGHWLAGYTVPRAAWKPRLIAEYNYASGDQDPNDATRGTFDSLYPTPHLKYGLCDQVGWRNIHDLHLGVELKPLARWTIAPGFHTWWLASPRDALYNAPGSPIARVPDGSAGRHVGEELDVDMQYTMSKNIQLGGGIGHIFPGRFLKQATPGRGYTFPYVMVTYSF